MKSALQYYGAAVRFSFYTCLVFYSLLFCLGAFLSLEAQAKKTNAESKKTGKELLLGDLVRFVMNHSRDVAIKQLEILKSDTALRKRNSQYSPFLEGAYTSSRRKLRYTNSFTRGDTIEHTELSLKARKAFRSGTYFETQISDQIIRASEADSSSLGSLGGSNAGSFTNIFSPATLHTTQLRFTLSQELLKNAFGFKDRRELAVIRNQIQIERLRLIYELNGLLVESMIDFWQLAIAQGNVRTAHKLLANARTIRSISLRKRRLGLSEGFEVKQWEALIAAAQIQLERMRLERDSYQRNLLRVMNMPPDSRIHLVPQILRKIPAGIDPKQDLEYAYRNRPDYLAIRLQKENARKTYEIAKNQLYPSLKLEGTYAGQGFDGKGSEAFKQSLESAYPETSFGIRMSYPLWDEASRVDARNAKIDLQSLSIKAQQAHRQIRDEVEEGLQQIQSSYRNLLHAKVSLKSNQRYYTGLLRRYRQGRFTATAVKNALDSLIQAEQKQIESAINLNISLLRYDLACNAVFDKYGVDIDQVLDKKRTMLQALEKIDDSY